MDFLGHMKTSRLEAVRPDIVDSIMTCNAGGATRAHDSMIASDIKGMGALGLWAWLWQKFQNSK